MIKLSFCQNDPRWENHFGKICTYLFFSTQLLNAPPRRLPSTLQVFTHPKIADKIFSANFQIHFSFSSNHFSVQNSKLVIHSNYAVLQKEFNHKLRTNQRYQTKMNVVHKLVPLHHVLFTIKLVFQELRHFWYNYMAFPEDLCWGALAQKLFIRLNKIVRTFAF